MDDPYPSSLHTDLKRDTDLHARQSDDTDMQAGLPLFEKYQFLSPRRSKQLQCTFRFEADNAVYSDIHGSLGDSRASLDPFCWPARHFEFGSKLHGF